MAQTIDLNHPKPELRAVAKVRSKIGQPHVIFDDSDYLSDLEDVGGNIFRAAATRLLAIANSEAYIQKVQETLEIKTDGAKLADSYRASANMLLKMVDSNITVPDPPQPAAPQGQTRRPRRVDGYSRNRHGC